MSASSPPRLVAFYLPQFHPVPENDAWWGKGFTEWRNVARARPLFEGHAQPRLPADLGFYDLRVPEAREAQAELATRYGIHGFCFYYYWFGGRRLLERPLEEMLSSGRPDLPFCICWANENWTRRWDGLDDEILVGQEHSPESDSRFILDVLPILRDPRYIRYQGRPVLLVYRADLLDDPIRTTDIWRERCREHGVPELHLVAAQTFGLRDPRPLGFDAAVEFPPHNIRGRRAESRVEGLVPGFEGKVHDYRDAVEYSRKRDPEGYRLHRGVMVSWDNTPRRGNRAHLWHHATPDAYEGWLRHAIARSVADPEDPEPLIFINAWNEWAEGAHLEPDDTWGHAYLQATRRALVSAPLVEPAAGEEPSAPGASPALETELRRQRRANAWLRAELEARDAAEAAQRTCFEPEPPVWIDAEPEPRGRFRVEGLGPLDATGGLSPRRGRRARIAGWATAHGPDPLGPGSSAALCLWDEASGRRYWAVLPGRELRPDLAHELGAEDGDAVSIHFQTYADYEGVEPGSYVLCLVQRSRAGLFRARAPEPVVIPGDAG